MRPDIRALSRFQSITIQTWSVAEQKAARFCLFLLSSSNKY